MSEDDHAHLSDDEINAALRDERARYGARYLEALDHLRDRMTDPTRRRCFAPLTREIQAEVRQTIVCELPWNHPLPHVAGEYSWPSRREFLARQE